MSYTIGLDYGTNSVRALVVDVRDGSELATAIYDYPHGDQGIVLDPKDPNLARQHPQDYLDGAEAVIREVLRLAGNTTGFGPGEVIGLGVDTTGSTPMPVDRNGTPLAFAREFSENPAAMAWLWKDHTSVNEAEEITRSAEQSRPEFLGKCGGTYSSEWFWAKIWHCLREDLTVFDAASTWVEIADWIPAVLTGTQDPAKTKRSICAAGHKAMFNPAWGGYPDLEFVSGLEPKLGRIRETLPNEAFDVSEPAGTLTAEWAERTGLPEGIPIAVGAFDAHLGGVGSGIKEGTLVKIIGTSTCDMMVVPMDEKLEDIPGMCGIVPGSVLPGYYGIEAGQSAVGDVFNWFVSYIAPGGTESGSHEELTKRAEKLAPGESGLLALDWHNGNRTILVDQRLTGLLVGMTLHTRPEEMYRAWIEATAFGARIIADQMEAHGQKVDQVINCGGISVKNPMVMQIYADVLNRPMKISRSEQTPALGSAMAGAVVAGRENGGWSDFIEAAQHMSGTLDTEFHPIEANVSVYDELYGLYRMLHDAFGVRDKNESLFPVMKQLLKIREATRGK